MLSDIISTYGERLVIAVVGVGLAFLALIVILWLVRRRGGPAPFLKGGRNRLPRLQVLDATAVDARRRLVLVRRDNVEHLIMIGGPTDIVVESGIGAIPIVTDISNGKQDHLPELTSETPSRSEPILSAARPQPKLETPQVAPVPAKSEVARQPVQLNNMVNQPVEPVATAPLVASPSLAPVAKPDPLPKAVSSARQTAPTPPQAGNNTSPSLASDTARASSPLMTSAMRPRATAPQLAPSEPAAASHAAPAGIAAATVAVSATSQIPMTATASIEPAFSQQVDDIFNTARERVLPDLASPAQPKADQPSFDDSFSADLRDDFESFLNAEIEKNAQPTAQNAPKAFDISSSTSDAQITGANVDRDAQKEMARIFGEMAVKRD